MQHPPKKRSKYNHKMNTIFNNAKDKKQCREIFKTLQDVIDEYDYPTMPQCILTEMAEYSTGSIIKCPNQDCHGNIYYLRGDNFNNINHNYNNNLCLYDYSCDECNSQFNVLQCKALTCDFVCVQTINENNNNTIACHFVGLCGSIYCYKHQNKNGEKCQICRKYLCNECGYDSAIHCSNYKCNQYYCNDCAQQIPSFQPDSLFYCIDCKSELFLKM